MIVGSGVDLEEVARVRAAIERHGARFLGRVYTSEEISYVEQRRNRFEAYAARFAAKEAGMKALGTGWNRGVHWADLEIVNAADGKPSLRLHGRAAEVAVKLGCCSINVSLSHTSHMVIAQVILES